MVTVATLSGVVANEVVTGYNYDSDRKEVQLFTGPRGNGGMPKDLLAHSLKVQRVSEDARVVIGGVTIIGLVPASRVGTTTFWSFVSNAGSTISIQPGPTSHSPVIKVGAVIDLADVQELDNYLSERGGELPQHIYDAVNHVRCAVLDALDITGEQL